MSGKQKPIQNKIDLTHQSVDHTFLLLQPEFDFFYRVLGIANTKDS